MTLATRITHDDSEGRKTFDLRRTRSLAVGIALVALVALIVGGFFKPQQCLQSYLWAFIFWINISLGGLGWVCLYSMTGGQWGEVVAPYLNAAMRTMLLMAVLFIPIAFATGELYPWAHLASHSAETAWFQHLWFQQPFFSIRAAAYFAIWLSLAALSRRWGAPAGLSFPNAASPSGRAVALGGVGVLLFALTTLFSSVDWTMSLSSDWHSTIYGMKNMVDDALSSLALAIVAAWMFWRPTTVQSAERLPKVCGDLGSLLLTTVITWAYFVYSQLIVIWSANFPKDIHWYLQRTRGGWLAIVYLIIALHLIVPFFCLLLRPIKRNFNHLAGLAALLLATHVVESYWYVVPSFEVHYQNFVVHWLDIAAWLAIGALWLVVFLTRLASSQRGLS